MNQNFYSYVDLALIFYLTDVGKVWMKNRSVVF